MTGRERARLTWWSVVEEIRVWDRITHQRFAPGTYRWAVALRNRVIIWLILLTGTRLAELVRLRVSGAHAHVLRGADGRIEAITIPQPSNVRPYRTFPLQGFEALATLLDIYIQRARPLLLGDTPDSHGRLIIGSSGSPYTRSALVIVYAKLRREIFGPRHRVTLYELRRITFLILHLGFRRPFFEVTRLAGWHPAHVLENADRFEEHGLGEVSLLTSDTARPTPDGERVIAELCRWLGEAAQDLLRLEYFRGAPDPTDEAS